MKGANVEGGSLRSTRGRRRGACAGCAGVREVRTVVEISVVTALIQAQRHNE